MKTGIGFAHGKIILIGEHAVVYKTRAIAIPFFATACTVKVIDSNKNELITSLYTGLLDDAPLRFEAIIYLIKGLISKYNLPALKYEIDSNIPISSGMGSSAAVAGAVVEAVYDYLGIKLSKEDRFNWIQYSEKIAHGNPSGIDALTTSNSKAIIYRKGDAPIEFDSKLNAYLVVGQSGQNGDTLEAINIVKKKIEEENKRYLIEELGNEVENAFTSYLNNDIISLASSLNNAQIILTNLGVSTNIIDNMVKMAKDNNALAAKLTGGGLGGCVISLAINEIDAIRIKYIWEKYTNKKAWILNLNEENI